MTFEEMGKADDWMATHSYVEVTLELARLRAIEAAARDAIEYYDLYLAQAAFIDGQPHGRLKERPIETLRAALGAKP